MSFQLVAFAHDERAAMGPSAIWASTSEHGQGLSRWNDQDGYGMSPVHRVLPPTIPSFYWSEPDVELPGSHRLKHSSECVTVIVHSATHASRYSCADKLQVVLDLLLDANALVIATEAVIFDSAEHRQRSFLEEGIGFATEEAVLGERGAHWDRKDHRVPDIGEGPGVVEPTVSTSPCASDAQVIFPGHCFLQGNMDALMSNDEDARSPRPDRDKAIGPFHVAAMQGHLRAKNVEVLFKHVSKSDQQTFKVVVDTERSAAGKAYWSRWTDGRLLRDPLLASNNHAQECRKHDRFGNARHVRSPRAASRLLVGRSTVQDGSNVLGHLT
ncbi:MAG: hypothetical protein ACYSWU_26280 [Planctomycetota bacterium]